MNRLDQYQKQALEFAEIIDNGAAPATDILAIHAGVPSATAEAAHKWRMTHRGVNYRLDAIRRAGFSHIIDAAIERYAERKAAQPLAPRQFAKVEIDPLEEHRLTREVYRLRAENRELLERLAGAQDFGAARARVPRSVEQIESPNDLWQPNSQHDQKRRHRSRRRQVAPIQAGADEVKEITHNLALSILRLKFSSPSREDTRAPRSA